MCVTSLLFPIPRVPHKSVSLEKKKNYFNLDFIAASCARYIFQWTGPQVGATDLLPSPAVPSKRTEETPLNINARKTQRRR